MNQLEQHVFFLRGEWRKETPAEVTADFWIAHEFSKVEALLA
jgi:hypothetical protein